MDRSPKPMGVFPLLVLHEFEPNSHKSVRWTSVELKADLCGLIWPCGR